ncbi:hypothetical protein [Hyphobacterium sp.]|uniref:hypothetical protein n=1 Tax=Hyphobacterium sp. TaxID=2004662 RepID=UPI003BA94CCA
MATKTTKGGAKAAAPSKAAAKPAPAAPAKDEAPLALVVQEAGLGGKNVGQIVRLDPAAAEAAIADKKARKATQEDLAIAGETA